MATPLTVAEFLAERPEFANAPTGMVQAALDSAWLRTAQDADAYRQIHSVQTARILGRSPMAFDMKIDTKDGRTAYDEEWDRLVDELGPALTRRLAQGGP